MGFITDALGFGKDQKKQVQQTKSALEQAQDPQPQGGFGGSVSKVVENLLDTEYYASAHSNNNITPGAPRSSRLPS